MKTELEARKARLMAEVAALVAQFSDETGLYVENIELDVRIVMTSEDLAQYRRQAIYTGIDMRVIQP